MTGRHSRRKLLKAKVPEFDEKIPWYVYLKHFEG